MRTKSIGKNAIKIWEILDENFALSIDELRIIAKLDERTFLLALYFLLETGEAFFITINDEIKICLTEND